MTYTATYSKQSIDLLHGGAQLADLSLLATRARNATLRAERGDALDELDLLALERMGEVLEEAAHSLEYFESAGTRGTLPSGTLTARVDVAIDVAESSTHGDSSRAATVLAALAQKVKGLESHGYVSDEGASDSLSDFLERLSSMVTKQLGNVGEQHLGY